MSCSELLGWTASALTLSTNLCQASWRTRGLAVAANVAFIAYGCTGGAPSVLALHLLLLPINAYRLIATLGALRTLRKRGRLPESAQA
jgi:hypothetical protein